MREDLHLIVDEMSINTHNQIILHMMIDLGKIKSFECQADRCILDSRLIDVAAVTTQKVRPKAALQIDHVIPQETGGSHRHENLRITHYVCNVSRAFYGRERLESTKDKFRAARAANRAIPTMCESCGHTFKGTIGIHLHKRQKEGCNV